MADEDIMLEVRDLKKYFKTPHRHPSCGGRRQLFHSEQARRWAWWASPAAASPPWAG